MILFVRTATIRSGKVAAAIAWSQQVAELATSVIGREIKVMTPTGGHYMQIAWVAEYASLADLDDAITKLFANADYMGMLSQAEDLFVGGLEQGVDTIWRQI